MGIILLIIALGFGGYVGYYVNTVFLTCLTLVALAIGFTLPQDTLAMVVFIAYVMLVGSAFLSAWISHILANEWIPDDIGKYFLRR